MEDRRGTGDGRQKGDRRTGDMGMGKGDSGQEIKGQMTIVGHS